MWHRRALLVLTLTLTGCDETTHTPQAHSGPVSAPPAPTASAAAKGPELDRALTRRIEAALSEWDDAAAVVVEAETGRIRALVAKGPDEDAAVATSLPSGSTLKPLTALAALRAGVLELDTTFTCTGKYVLEGETFRCHGRHGKLDLAQALVLSDNAYFYGVAARLDHDALTSTLREFGLGTAPAGVSNAAAGILPTKDWLTQRHGRHTRAHTVLLAVGHGDIRVTPLQLARAYAILATGHEPSLRLAGRPKTPEPQMDARFLPELRAALRRVVSDSQGTGHRSGSSASLAGKTGTAELDDTTEPRVSVGWFAGWTPAAAPKLAFALRVRGGTGRDAAAVAHRVFAR